MKDIRRVQEENTPQAPGQRAWSRLSRSCHSRLMHRVAPLALVWSPSQLRARVSMTFQGPLYGNLYFKSTRLCPESAKRDLNCRPRDVLRSKSESGHWHHRLFLPTPDRSATGVTR